MIQAAITNVIGPTITAENPNGLRHKIISHTQELLRQRAVVLFQQTLESIDAPALGLDALLGAHIRITDGRKQFNMAAGGVDQAGE
jgi:hypothetical protein